MSFIWQLDFYNFLLSLRVPFYYLLYTVQGDLLQHFTVALLDVNLMLQEECRYVNQVINHAQIFVSSFFPRVVV